MLSASCLLYHHRSRKCFGRCFQQVRKMFLPHKCLRLSRPSSPCLSISHYIWDKQPRNPLLILHPRIPILFSTLLNISDSAMHNHTSEKQRIEPWERGVETGNSTPWERKEEIASVVNLARSGVYFCEGCVSRGSEGREEDLRKKKGTRMRKRKKILTPSITQNRIPSLSLDANRILYCFPRQLWERLSVQFHAAFLCSKHVFLAVCRIPDPVDEQISNKQQSQDIRVPVVLRRVVVGDVESAMAVR